MKQSVINFIILICICFVIGFITSLNGLFTGLFSTVFQTNHFEANFVSFSFFLAYFIGSLLYVISHSSNNKLLHKLGTLGYKKLLSLGLILASCGSLLFAFGSYLNHYITILCGLFIIGVGFSYLQISVNPLILILGNKNTATGRINLAQAFNSLATTLAPTFGVVVIYHYLHIKTNIHHLIYPYFIFMIIFLCMFLLINRFMQLDELNVPSIQLDNSPFMIWQQHKLIGGMIAIFCCVGLETAISSNLITYVKYNMHLDNIAAGSFLALHWGGFMIGRFLAATAMSKMTNIIKICTMLLCTIILTTLLIWINHINGIDVWYFVGYQLIVIITFSIIQNNPRVTLMLFGLIVTINLIIVAIFTGNTLTLWALVGTGLFNSIMFPTIFSLATQQLDKHREYASSLLVMMIVGGAIIPLVQGYIADIWGMNISFIVPAVATIYIVLYGGFYRQLK